MEALKIIEDGKGRTITGLNMSTFVNARLLAASTAETVTVPQGAKYALLGGPIDCWVDKDKTAVIPAADIVNGSSPVYIAGASKELRNVTGIKHLSVISASAGIFTAEFYE